MESTTPRLTKKAARTQVRSALSTLTDLQNSLGEKKFKKRVKKIEELLLEGLKKKKKKGS